MVSRSRKESQEGPQAAARLSAKSVQGALDQIADALRDNGMVVLHHFGTFKVVDLAPRQRRHPGTGELIAVPARKSIRFKPSPALLKHLR